MAQLNQVFDATTVEPISSFEPVPNGEYVCLFTDSEIKDTKSGTGTYLQLTAEIVEGPYKGRLIWERINLTNPNTTAVEIGQKTLSAICHAVNVPRVQDSVELHNKPFKAKVVVKKSLEYGDSNEIKGYSAMAGAPSPTPAAAAAPEQQAQAPANWAAGGANPFRQQ